MKTLADVINASESAEAALLFLSMRERFRKEPMRVARFKKALRNAGIKYNDNDLHKFFKDLHEAGEGKLIISRTIPFIFEWKRNFIDMANEALKLSRNKDKVVELKANIKPLIQRPQKPAQPAPAITQTVIVLLPNGMNVKLEIPKNMKSSDITTVANQLKSLTA
jgi:hypothetical protein